MQRRSFLQLLAGGLLVPAELFRGRSQVSVSGLWAPATLCTIAKKPIDSFLIGTEVWYPYEINPLGNGEFLHRVRRKT